jgi:hypothetical protein
MDQPTFDAQLAAHAEACGTSLEDIKAAVAEIVTVAPELDLDGLWQVVTAMTMCHRHDSIDVLDLAAQMAECGRRAALQKMRDAR